eukprot:TRINITY_DN3605_c0_g1_i1.p1 TRINITY_DN3605_c0_g1~~TRINITY_DN3605_c0_g1_i1.p1  ORF type:complete len:55 (-),score=8.15 TRINITY_DN3605_c0_g1_i1:61-225(-)
MIARALYQEADVYFLDDILSAVDPDVGDEIFNRAINGRYDGYDSCIGYELYTLT